MIIVYHNIVDHGHPSSQLWTTHGLDEFQERVKCAPSSTFERNVGLFFYCHLFDMLLARSIRVFLFFFHFHGFNQFVVHRHFPPSFWWQRIIPSSISSFALPAGSSRPRRVLVQGFHVLVLFWTRMPREQTALAVSVIDGRHWTFSSHRENTNNKQQNVHFFFWLYFFFLGPFFNSRSLIIFCAGHKSDRDSISMLWYRQTPSRWAQDNGERARSIISRGRKTIFLLLLLRPFFCVCVTT